MKKQMRRIACKGGIDQLPELIKEGFSEAELFLAGEEDLERSVDFGKMGIGIFSVHEFKGDFEKIKDFPMASNIADPGEAGDLTEELLRKTILYAKEHGIPRIVTHLGFYDAMTSDKLSSIQVATKRLARLYDPDVSICIENSEFRPDLTAYCKERQIVGAEDFKMLLKETTQPIGVVLDIEHLYASAVFRPLYEKFRELYVGNGLTKEEYNKTVDKELQKFATEDPQRTMGIIRKYIEDSFEVTRGLIEGIHTCGSDYHQYVRPPSGAVSRVGSEIPVGFEGEFEGIPILDRVDHKHYLKLSNAPLVAEVRGKGAMTHTEAMVFSRKNLREILKEKV